MRLVLIIMTVFLSGCASFQDPDFNKPLIVIPEKQEVKPIEEKVWIDTKTNRVWVNPYVDENGDLVDGHYKHIVSVPGHWEVKPDARKQ